jgi:hypothetical protein
MAVSSTSGQGRKKGNLNKATREVKEIARPYGPGAVRVLAQLAGLIDGQPPAESEPARIMACRELLDRAYGKSTVLIVGDEEQPVRIDFRWAPAMEPEPTAPIIDAAANGEDGDTADGGITITWAGE